MISAQNLADRYGISKTAILKFVRSNIDVINKEKENAYQSGIKGNWEFTEDAVRIIDRLRNVSSSVAERPADTERVQQLLIENSNLKTFKFKKKITPFKKPTMQPDSRHLPTSSTESMRIQIMNRISTRQHVKKEILQKSLDETNFLLEKRFPA
mgnify:CR=1 FL=1